MAQEMGRALKVAHQVAALYEESSTRLWYPRISLQWLGVPPGPFISDDAGDLVYASGGTIDGDLQTDAGADERLTVMEARQGLAERAYTFTLVHGRPVPASARLDGERRNRGLVWRHGGGGRGRTAPLRRAGR